MFCFFNSVVSALFVCDSSVVELIRLRLLIKISVSDSCGIIPAKDSVELVIQKPTADFVITTSRKETDEIIYFRDLGKDEIIKIINVEIKEFKIK